MDIVLERIIENDNFTIGHLFLPNNIGANGEPTGGSLLFINELPYKDNQRSISCIPKGDYILKNHISPKFGKCIKIFDKDGVSEVIGRSQILIHKGNSVRDFIDKTGYQWKKESDGCQLIGSDADTKQGLVYQSKQAFELLLNYMKDKDNIRYSII